ncbi:hypothetical protein JCM5353_000810 [Sporobolomyces roseus]
MATQAVAPNPLRPHSLLDLPTEVLAEIVQMCAEQDRAFLHRSNLLRSYYDADSTVYEILDGQSDNGMGGSLSIVSLVSRVMNQLAKPHLFLTLWTSKTVDRPAFWYNFAPTCLRYIRHLALDTSNLPALDFTVAFLDSFESLEELTITGAAASAIFPSRIAEANRSARYIFRPTTLSGKKLRSRESKIRTLNLLECPTLHALDCLDIFSSVRILRYKGDLPGSTLHLGRFVKVLNRIDSICLEEASFKGPSFTPPSSLLRIEQSAPRLSHISLETTEFDQNTLDWIKEFRHCLRTLSITCSSDRWLHNKPPSRLRALDQFPQLHTISVIGSALIASSIFRDINRQTFPSLRRIRLSYDDSESDGFADSDEALLTIFRTFPFVHLQYDPPNQYFSTKAKQFLIKRATAANVHLQLHDYPQVSAASNPFMEDSDEALRRHLESFVAEEDQSKDQMQLEEGLARMREHLERRLSTATRDQNVLELYRLSILLRPLEFDRLAQLD